MPPSAALDSRPPLLAPPAMTSPAPDLVRPRSAAQAQVDLWPQAYPAARRGSRGPGGATPAVSAAGAFSPPGPLTPPPLAASSTAPVAAPGTVRWAWESKPPQQRESVSAEALLDAFHWRHRPSSPQLDQPRTPPKAPEVPPAGPSDPDETPPKGPNPAPVRAHLGEPRGVPTPQRNSVGGALRARQIQQPQKEPQKQQQPLSQRLVGEVPLPAKPARRAASDIQQGAAGERRAPQDGAATREAQTREEPPTLREELAHLREEHQPAPLASRALAMIPLEPLGDFSVTSPRFGATAAAQSTEELPMSLRHALNFIRCLPALPRTSPECQRPFLPAQVAPRPCLVLDLDETLVHCNRGGNRTPAGTIPAAPDLLVEFDDIPSYGGVAFRPFVQFFLEVAAKSFEIVVFTASQQAYADKVINALDPTGAHIHHRLYRQHCTELRGAFFKELGLLGRPLSQCILVDNSPISVACNADNSVLIRSWYGERNDQELMELLAVLQDLQVYGGDADRYLNHRYGLREFFHAMREGVARQR